MTLFTLRSLKKDFGLKEILKNANFSLEEGDKVGLIGTNGSGKSTLLKMIAGLEPHDGGDIWVNASAKIIYLPQQPNLDENLTVLDEVFAHSREERNLIREYEALSLQLEQNTENNPQILSRLATLSQHLDTLKAWDLETNAKIILTKLGIQDFSAKIGQLSGGYRKRIALASALLSEPDVLLMDEPTNHLDALSVEWLQSYLKRYQGALLLVTHDRYFLDQVTNRILEIDRGELFNYTGNYAYFLQKKAEAEASDLSSQHKHRGRLRRELEWLKRGPKARSTKQKARIDRIHGMQSQEFQQKTGKVEISTPTRRIGKKVIEVNNITKAYEGKILFKEFTHIFTPHDRVGIIGENGTGKSTLMNIITGKIAPDQGTVDIGDTIHIGYFDQHSEELGVKENQRVIEYLKEVAELVKTSDGSVITASQMLERFLFPPDQQYAPLHKLSGGEKRRLFLLRVLMEAPNVLILDEPTNDLDIQTLSILEEYLEEFKGCVIVVSHDRYFLDRTVDTIFALEKGGKIQSYPGNYSLYLEYKQIQETEKNNILSSPVSQPEKMASSSTTKPKRLSFKEKKDYETLEAKITELETQKAGIENTLYENPPSQFEELQHLTQTLADLEAEIHTLTERWLSLAEKLEV